MQPSRFKHTLIMVEFSMLIMFMYHSGFTKPANNTDIQFFALKL